MFRRVTNQTTATRSIATFARWDGGFDEFRRWSILSRLQLPSLTPQRSIDAEPARPTNPARIRWAALLARIYDVLPLLCPACGGPMRILAFLTDPLQVPGARNNDCVVDHRKNSDRAGDVLQAVLA